jgi:ribosomal protein S18 acetylase RimI-like enzyme
MKRLYVAPAARGLGVGKALVDAVIHQARRIGYREMRLDTLPDMAEAVGIYRRAGFEPIAPYYKNPIAETVYFGLSLAPLSEPTEEGNP